MPMSEIVADMPGWVECNRQKPDLPDDTKIRAIRQFGGSGVVDYRDPRFGSIGPVSLSELHWGPITHYMLDDPASVWIPVSDGTRPNLSAGTKIFARSRHTGRQDPDDSDVFDACDWLWSNISHYRIDPECVVAPVKPDGEGWFVANGENPGIPDEALFSEIWNTGGHHEDYRQRPSLAREHYWPAIQRFRLHHDQPWIRCNGVRPSLPAGTKVYIREGHTDFDEAAFVDKWYWGPGVTHYKIAVLGSGPTTQQPMKVGTPAWTRRKTALAERYYTSRAPITGRLLYRWHERMEYNRDAGRYRLVDNPTEFLELKREYAGRAAVVRKAVQSKDRMAIYWMRHNWPFRSTAPVVDGEAYGLIDACSNKFNRRAAQRWEEPSFVGALRDRVYQTLELRMLLDNHFVHVSEDDPMKVAFVPNYDKLKADLYTRMKPGKYLTKFFGSVLSGQEIKKLAEEYAVAHGPVEVKFARDEASIVRAIAEGPSESCMANLCHKDSRDDYSHWRGNVHPAAVYAGSGDFEVAYVENAQGEVTGRVICNARKKLMARPYGDYSRMVKELERQGYRSEDGALLACRLRVIPSGNDDYPYIMAYVDAGTASGGGHLYFTEIQDKQGNWFLTTSDESDCSTYDGYDNNGVTDAQAGEDDKDDEDDDEDHYTCDSCGDRFHIDARHYSEYHQRDFCPGCARCYWTLAYTGGRDEDYVNDDEVVEFDGISYLDDAGVLSAHGLVKLHNGDVEKLDNTAFIDGDYYHIDDCVMLKTCYYDGEFALEEDCVKDYQDDWIKRCDAVEIGPDQYRHTDDAEELEAA